MRKSRTNGPFTIFLEMEPGNSKPINVWASHVVLRKGKEILPFGKPQSPDNYLVRIPWCEENGDIFILMTLKAWEEDLYDEANRDHPWYPLISVVIHQFMEFENGCLTFIEGEAPDLEKLSQNENARYAAQLYYESQLDVSMKIEEDSITLSEEDLVKLIGD